MEPRPGPRLWRGTVPSEGPHTFKEPAPSEISKVGILLGRIHSLFGQMGDHLGLVGPPLGPGGAPLRSGGVLFRPDMAPLKLGGAPSDRVGPSKTRWGSPQ